MGEIRTVKGRERERATAVERVVVTPQRQKLLGKSMPGRLHNWRGTAHRVHAMCSMCGLPSDCGHPSVAPLDRRTLIARTHAMVQCWYGKQRNTLRSALLRK
jgi:hypothetical protein